MSSTTDRTNGKAATMNGETLAAALGYADLGWRVVPVAPREKRPIIAEWQNASSIDHSTIESWLDATPAANIGIRWGRESGVIDVEGDGPEADKILLELFGGDVPVVPTYTAHRGKHRIFQWCPGFPEKACFHIGDLEVRTGNGDKGAQSVVPPSVHPTGKRYEWLPGLSPDDVVPGVIPPEVIQRIIAKIGGNGPDVAPGCQDGTRKALYTQQAIP